MGQTSSGNVLISEAELGGFEFSLPNSNSIQIQTSVSDSTAEKISLVPADISSSDSAGELPQNIAQAWSSAIGALKAQLDIQVFTAFIESLKPISFDRALMLLQLEAPSKLHCSHVEKNFLSRISAIVTAELDTSTPIDIRVSAGQNNTHLNSARDREIEARQSSIDTRHSRSSQIITNLQSVAQVTENNNEARQNPASLQGSRQHSIPYIVVKRPLEGFKPPSPAINTAGGPPDRLSGGVNPKYTFSNFVVGHGNQFCHAAALRVSEQPGLSYNPLFIYGGVGLGKTHLLHAIGNAILERTPQAKILYISSESFTNELILSLRNAKMEEFKNRIRNIDVLLVDDIQFMSGKERTQEEFFHTFNALYNAKHQIVISSDKVPQDIIGMEERLQTRFSWGLTADIQAPDFETRVAIVKRKAALDVFEVPESVVHLIAEKVSSNVRELEGALTKLQAVSSLQNIPITQELAMSALRHLLQPKTVAITVDDIKKAVGLHFGLKVSDIISKRRTKNLSFPRHIAMYLCRKYTTSSYPEIGHQFGGRDHSSVIHAANVVAQKIGNDLSVKGIVKEIEKKLAVNH